MSVKNWVLDITTVDGLCLQPISRPEEVASDRSWVLVRKYSVRVLGKFNRGDVLYLRSPEDPNSHLVRRLIGLEGDWMSEQGELQKVPQGHCWLEGSTLKGTQRHCTSCVVPLALLEGRVSHVIWPLSNFGEVESYTPPGRVVVQAEDKQKVDS